MFTSMTKLLRRLSGRPSGARPRLGLDVLEDRLVPAAITFLPALGQLNIFGSGTENVSVSSSTTTSFLAPPQTKLTVNDNGSVSSYSYTSGMGSSNIVINYYDDGGNSTFVNNTSLNAVMNVSNGASDHYTGGLGANTFKLNYVSSGNDVFTGRGGNNEVIDQALLAGTTTTLSNTALTNVNPNCWFPLHTQLSDIQGAEIDGAGNDTMDARGFSGSVILRGVNVGTMYGGTGSNDFITPANGSYTIFAPGGVNTFETHSGDQVYGLANRTLSAADLGQSGTLFVSLQGNSLIFNGPSGAGFAITGPWQTGSLWGRDVFYSASPVTLESALGNIQLPGFTVLTQSTTLPNAGAFSTVNDLTLGLDTANPSSPMNGFDTSFGLNLDAPGMSVGIDLGCNLSNLNLPLANSVPYLYITGATGYTLSYGNASVGTPGHSATIAFDPADPALFVKVDNFGFGDSVKGQIPFVPASVPSALASSLTDGVAGYGNLYGEGTIDLGDLPVTLDGSAVIGLDVNHTGAPLGISGATARNLLNGSTTLTSVAGQALGDVFVGVNGTLSVGYEEDGFNLSLNVGQGSVVYQPGLLALRAESVDPLANTFLDNIVHPTVSVMADGYIRNFNNFNFTLTESLVTLAGGFSSSGALNFGNNGVSAAYSVRTPLDGSVELQGSIYANGSVFLQSTESYSVNAGVAEVSEQTVLTFGGSVSSGITFGASFNAEFSLEAGGWGLYADVNANLLFSAGPSGVRISGSGSAGGGIDTWFGSWGVSLGVSFNNSGFTVITPSPFPNVSVDW